MCKDAAGQTGNCKDCTCEDCKHENLKYCECCGGVHCVDCGEKWTEDQPEIHQFFYDGSCSVCHCTPCCCSWIVTSVEIDGKPIVNDVHGACGCTACEGKKWNPT